MADFSQNGKITTLHNLNTRSLEDLEKELKFLSETTAPMCLLLPSLFSELEGPALKNIVEKLKGVNYIKQIIIGLDRADKEQFEYAKKYFSELPQNFRILWNDGPRLKAVDAKLQEKGLAPKEMGKGRNVWYCMGYFLASKQAKVIALHDCDILTYERDMVAKLFYPVAHPGFGFKFAKGYYYRAAEGSLNGRVTRLLVSPLIDAMRTVCREHGFLDYLDTFRYPLSGEFAMWHDVVRNIRIPSDWGLEIGTLSEAYRNLSLRHICQVDIADAYDHKHQDLSLEDKNKGLAKMSTDICKAFFRKLATNGEIFSIDKIRSIKACYYREALDYVERYFADAAMNGLKLDRDKEEQAIEMFAKTLIDAGEHFLESPSETPFMHSWSRVVSAIPDIFDLITDAVEKDNA